MSHRPGSSRSPRLSILAAALVAASCGDGTGPFGSRTGCDIAGRYVVVYESSVRDSPRATAALAAKYGFEVREVWDGGFTGDMEPVTAFGLSREPTVAGIDNADACYTVHAVPVAQPPSPQ